MRARQVTNSKLRKLLTGKEAQDLVEYALAISLIALALIGGMNRVATALLNAFTNISTTLTPVASPPVGRPRLPYLPRPVPRNARVRAGSIGYSSGGLGASRRSPHRIAEPPCCCLRPIDPILRCWRSSAA